MSKSCQKLLNGYGISRKKKKIQCTTPHLYNCARSTTAVSYCPRSLQLEKACRRLLHNQTTHLVSRNKNTNVWHVINCCCSCYHTNRLLRVKSCTQMISTSPLFLSKLLILHYESIFLRYEPAKCVKTLWTPCMCYG